MSILDALLGPKGYLFDMRCKLPGGEAKVIRITGRILDEFGKAAFMAGVEFGQLHPELQPKEAAR